jgi:hypothetical protein
LEIGRLLIQVEWRDANGEATFRAMAQGVARRLPSGQNHPAIWHRKGCALWLESRQLVGRQPDRIGLWAELLAALNQGEPAIAESAWEMALGRFPANWSVRSMPPCGPRDAASRCIQPVVKWPVGPRHQNLPDRVHC